MTKPKYTKEQYAKKRAALVKAYKNGEFRNIEIKDIANKYGISFSAARSWIGQCSNTTENWKTGFDEIYAKYKIEPPSKLRYTTEEYREIKSKVIELLKDTDNDLTPIQLSEMFNITPDTVNNYIKEIEKLDYIHQLENNGQEGLIQYLRDELEKSKSTISLLRDELKTGNHKADLFHLEDESDLDNDSLDNGTFSTDEDTIDDDIDDVSAAPKPKTLPEIQKDLDMLRVELDRLKKPSKIVSVINKTVMIIGICIISGFQMAGDGLSNLNEKMKDYVEKK